MSRSFAEYRIAFICMSGRHSKSMLDMLEVRHYDFPTPGMATFVLGEMQGHNVLVAIAPDFEMATVQQTIEEIVKAFPGMALALSVGIGGGMPSKDHDIRLGDIVVGMQNGDHPSMVQLDLGRVSNTDQFAQMALLWNTELPTAMTAAVMALKHLEVEGKLTEALWQDPKKYARGTYILHSPEKRQDRLFQADYLHNGRADCLGCDNNYIIDRAPRSPDDLVVHHGTIVSSTQVVKNGLIRDQISHQTGAICCEMDANGFTGEFPCLFIRGICDYADSHKDTRWQDYAMTVAAAYAKKLLSYLPSDSIDLLDDPQRAQVPHSVNNSYTPKSHTIPRPRNRLFFDYGQRSAGNSQIERIEHMFQQGAKTVVLVGQGGVGKTELALEYCYRFLQDSELVIWLHANTAEQLVASTHRVLAQFGIRSLNSTREHVFGILLRWLQAVHRTKWLLVLDDLDDYSLLEREELPKRSGGRLIICTRNKQLPLCLLDAAVINIKPLEADAGAAMLKSFLLESSVVNDSTDSEIRDLSSSLGNLPLALRHAALYIEQNSIDLQEYKTKLLKASTSSQTVRHQSLVGTLRTIFDQLSPAAANLVLLMSFFAPDSIQVSILINIQYGEESQPPIHWHETRMSPSTIGDSIYSFLRDDGAFIETINKLKTESLIMPGHERGVYMMHRIVRDYIQGTWCTRPQFVELQSYFLFCLNSAFPLPEQQRWNRCESLLPHVHQAEVQMDDSWDDIMHENWSQIFNKAGLYMIEQGEYKGAVRMLEKASGGLQKILGQYHPRSLDSLSNLSYALRHLGRWDEAESIFETVLKIRQAELGFDNPEVLRDMSELTMLYRDRGYYQKAESLCSELTVKTQRLLGTQHPITLLSQKTLLTLYCDQGSWSQARSLGSQLVIDQQMAVGLEHADTLEVVGLLITVYDNTKEWDKAIQLSRQLIAAKTKMLGAKHLETLKSLDVLSHLYNNSEDYSRAESLAIQAIRARTEVLGDSHPDTLASMANLASIARKQDRLAAAKEIELKISQTSEATSTPELEKTIFSNRYYSLRLVARLCEQLFDSRSAWSIEQYDEKYILRAPRRLTEQEIRWCSVANQNESGRTNITNKAGISKQAEMAIRNPPYSEELDFDELNVPLAKPGNDHELLVPMVSIQNDRPVADQGLRFYLRKAFWEESDEHNERKAAYGSLVGVGQTCQVEAVETQLSYSSASQITSEPTYTKLAIKRLLKGTSQRQFYHEIAMLRRTRRTHHPNIIRLISSFRVEILRVQYFNFVFPLALGNLKQLLRGQLDASIVPSSISSLWYQFEGLASALCYLHNECQTAHRDIKPSNLLIFQEERAGRMLLFCKISDFGLATDLSDATSFVPGTKEMKSAWAYDAPELRHHAQEAHATARVEADAVQAGDVWKLGAVYLEMATYLSLGHAGILNFRNYITTQDSRIISDGISPNRLDDGIRVKEEVVTWIKGVAATKRYFRCLEPILLSMLGEVSTRLNAQQVWEATLTFPFTLFKEGSRFLEFKRPLPMPTKQIDGPVLNPSTFILSEQQEKEFRSSVPDETSLESSLRVNSVFDNLKLSVEKMIDSHVDWRPFSNPVRPIKRGQTRIIWEWCHLVLICDMPELVAEKYRRVSCKPLSSFAGSGHGSHSISAYTQPNDTATSSQTSGTSLAKLAQSNTSGAVTSRSSSMTVGITNQGQTSLQEIDTRELYWCINKAWTETNITVVDRIHGDRRPLNDRMLCDTLISAYRRARGQRGRFLSWKTCGAVHFIHFRIKFNDLGEIACIAKHRLPYSASSPTTDKYEYQLSAPEEAHMLLAAEQIVAGMHYPEKLGAGSVSTLQMIPQRLQDALKLKQGEDGWGIHAIEVWSLRKLVLTLATAHAFSFTFIMFWLVFVSKTDLQNAFIPHISIVTGLSLFLALPQVLTGA